MAKLESFYVSGMGTKKIQDSAENNVTRKCFLWPGASGNVCFTNRPDSATAGDWKVGDFEDMLNTVHTNLLKGHPFCSMDKWFDNHYAIDSQSASASTILDYVNKEDPMHACANDPMRGSGLAYVFDPTGRGIQLDLQVGLPNDCKSQMIQETGNFSRRLQGGGKYNPACTTDTSKCGASPSPTPPSPPSPPTPPTPTPPTPTPPTPPSPPAPPSPPTPPAPKNCGACRQVVGSKCPPWTVGFGPACMDCVFRKRASFSSGGCDPRICQNQLKKA